ncbi:MAG TPA: Ada metal-binding domain-containing protein, partial [Nocardioides sp.]|uniref:bifunctional transcriptional activator/DNA repair enzyme AdaA n=1 Tax=Nocardioides sp. TaxID=35761 RepID=UPI002F40D228
MTPTTAPMHLDLESCYRAVKSRDRRFDGVFYTAVRTTGIYCRPSCPARTPAFHNVTFHPTAAAAQAAGYRACKRCLPDATPGSPDWDVAADVAGRAMRLIADGVVDREGVDGVARRIGYTPRHLSRILTQELGAGPLALARAKRAQTARVLLETTDLGAADIAFAAGFSSVRQFNETIREVYDATPTRLRGGRDMGGPGGTLQLRLAVRTPFGGRSLLGFLAHRCVAGVEVA